MPFSPEIMSGAETWAKALRSGAAPHQQKIAHDVLAMVDYIKHVDGTGDHDAAAGAMGNLQAQLDAEKAKVANLTSNIDQVLQDRDDARAELRKAKDEAPTADALAAIEMQRDAALERVAELEKELEEATAPAKGKTGGKR